MARAVGCDVMSVDKEFVLGLLLQAVNINDEDKILLKLKGKRFLEEMVGRQE